VYISLPFMSSNSFSSSIKSNVIIFTSVNLLNMLVAKLLTFSLPVVAVAVVVVVFVIFVVIVVVVVLVVVV